jgi:hypothetical protein
LGEFFTELTGFAGRGGLRRRRCGELLVTRNWWRVEDDVECWILDFEWWSSFALRCSGEDAVAG